MKWVAPVQSNAYTYMESWRTFISVELELQRLKSQCHKHISGHGLAGEVQRMLAVWKSEKGIQQRWLRFRLFRQRRSILSSLEWSGPHATGIRRVAGAEAMETLQDACSDVLVYLLLSVSGVSRIAHRHDVSYELRNSYLMIIKASHC